MTATGIGDSSVLRQANGVLGAPIEEQLILLNADLAYLGLDSIGARIWELIEEPRSVAELTQTLTAEYEVTPEQCRADVVPFLSALVEHHLAEVVA